MQLPVLRWSYFSANTGLNCFPKVNNFENPQTQTINNGVNLFKKLNEEFGDFMKKDPTSMPWHITAEVLTAVDDDAFQWEKMLEYSKTCLELIQ